MSLLKHVLTGCTVVLGSAALLVLALWRTIRAKRIRKRSAVVLVLGDIGRSPRMMYHAASLARHERLTTIVGYNETLPIAALLESPHVRIKGIANPPKPLLRLPWVLRAPIRIVWQILSVLKILLLDSESHAEIMLVQNPPSIPTLALAQLVSYLTGTKVIIDWHNTGYSILAMRTGEESPLCRIARWFEGYFGKKAFAHLFVTQALREHLVNLWGLEMCLTFRGKQIVLHDRPPRHFRRTTIMEKHALFIQHLSRLRPLLPPNFTSTASETLFTRLSAKNDLVNRADRPALIVSSTSWTADEDFGPLLTALEAYHQAIADRSDLPKILVLITGKGSLKASFEAEVAEREKSWKMIAVRCLFLPVSDYPSILGSADLGISMHSSSSGRDLPMKVVDMFGCKTPVLAKGFPAIGELVQSGKNGEIWQTGEELGELLIDLLADFPHNARLARLQGFFHAQTPSAQANRGHTEHSDEWMNWDQNWDKHVYQGLFHPYRL